MNKFKLVLWIVILAIIALVIFQNQDFFMNEQSLRINLWVVEEYQTPALPIAIPFLIFFVFGLLIEYLFTVPDRFRSGKTNKKLTATVTSQTSEITKLKEEIAVLKGEDAVIGKDPVADGKIVAPETTTGESGNLTTDNTSDNPGESGSKKTS